MTDLSCAQARALAIRLLDGEITPTEQSAVLGHVATCPTCPALYRALVAVHARLGAAPRVSQPSARLTREVAALLRETE